MKTQSAFCCTTMLDHTLQK